MNTPKMSSAYITNTSTQFIPRIFRKNGVISPYEADDIHRHPLGKQPCGDQPRGSPERWENAQGSSIREKTCSIKKENHGSRRIDTDQRVVEILFWIFFRGHGRTRSKWDRSPCLFIRVYPRSFAGKMGSFQSGYLHFAPVVVRILLFPHGGTLGKCTEVVR
jgi:hypothetical protein